MASKTLTRADLSEAVHRDIGLSRTEISRDGEIRFGPGFHCPG
jgi:hypothetical protein